MGSWSVKWSDGKTVTYNIVNGVVSIVGQLGSSFKLTVSTERQYSVSQGWYQFTYGNYIFYIRYKSNRVQFHKHSVGSECTRTYGSLNNLCDQGSATKATSSSTDGDQYSGVQWSKFFNRITKNNFCIFY